MATIHLKYFAMLREARNCREEDVVVPAGTTAASLYQELFPEHYANGLPVSFAINNTYVKADAILEDADELAFLPPVGGG